MLCLYACIFVDQTEVWTVLLVFHRIYCIVFVDADVDVWKNVSIILEYEFVNETRLKEGIRRELRKFDWT